MALPVWPATLPVPGIPSREKFKFPARRHEYELGYQYASPKFTRGRRWMTLTWKFLTEAQYATLESFFVSAQGLEFDWTHPRTGVTKRFMIMSDELDQGFESPGGRTDVSLDIAER